MPNIIDTTDPIDLANRSNFFHDNVVVPEIDNLLSGWPTYILDFTPEHPGPLKLILRLKDASEFRIVEDGDSDNEAEGTPGRVKSELNPVTEVDPDATMICEATQEPVAKPVALHVIPKDTPAIVRMREKFKDDHGYTWPPCRRFREISARTKITQTKALMALPAAVAALKLN
ncbi:hypothetical protein EV702DRAFT_1050227 [Suillus placidus]|uniref:Uncharacterized protein n=1 Tax=Suillus placidus TaxID=48579 RepID=A0A9P6ZJJ2_9AGAM|nr:hypothetical protein EV702DRAFT_1050227 [Suillus placidus]